MIHGDSFITSPAELSREGKCKGILTAECSFLPKRAGLLPGVPVALELFVCLGVDFDWEGWELRTEIL